MIATGLVLIVLGWAGFKMFPPSSFYFSWKDWFPMMNVCGWLLVLAAAVKWLWVNAP